MAIQFYAWKDKHKRKKHHGYSRSMKKVQKMWKKHHRSREHHALVRLTHSLVIEEHCRFPYFRKNKSFWS